MINEYSCKVKRGAPAVAIWFGNTLSMKMGTLDLFLGTLKNVLYPLKTSAPAMIMGQWVRWVRNYRKLYIQ